MIVSIESFLSRREQTGATDHYLKRRSRNRRCAAPVPALLRHGRDAVARREVPGLNVALFYVSQSWVALHRSPVFRPRFSRGLAFQYCGRMWMFPLKEFSSTVALPVLRVPSRLLEAPKGEADSRRWVMGMVLMTLPFDVLALNS